MQPANPSKYNAYKPKNKRTQKRPTKPFSLNDVPASPISNKNRLSLKQDGSLTPEHFPKAGDLSVDKVYSKENKLNSTKTKPLPKINNPKAENRLKALIDLFGKKNPAFSSKNNENPSSIETPTEDSKSRNHKPRKNILPPLTALIPTAFPNQNFEELSKSPPLSTKIPSKGDGLERKESSKIILKHLEPLPEINQSKRDISAPSREKKRVVFKPLFNKQGEDKNMSPPQDSDNSEEECSLGARLKENQRKKKSKKFFELPYPDVDFDSRVHRISIDDALARLNQLTNQSSNARKDLLKVQENALALRLRYERSHKNLEKVGSEREPRNH